MSKVAELQQTLEHSSRILSVIEANERLEFTLFCRLPAELQQIVWNRAVYVPRIVGVKRRMKREGRNRFFPAGPPPPLLLVNKASRAEALKVYLPLTNDLARPTSPILTNASVDTIWVIGRSYRSGLGRECQDIYADFESLSGSCLTSMPRVAVPCPFWKEFRYDYMILDALRSLNGLKNQEVIFVVGNEKHARRHDTIFCNPPGKLVNLDAAEDCRENWAWEYFYVLTWYELEKFCNGEISRVHNKAIARRTAFIECRFFYETPSSMLSNAPYHVLLLLINILPTAYPDLDPDTWGHPDVKGWNIPRIKFLESANMERPCSKTFLARIKGDTCHKSSWGTVSLSIRMTLWKFWDKAFAKGT
jgi:hypothetical protein